MDSAGNQCALITSSFSPCRMVIVNEKPDWTKCSFNTEENKPVINEILSSTLTVNAKEFWPEGKNSWKGIPIKDWFDYVMDDKTERP